MSELEEAIARQALVRCLEEAGIDARVDNQLILTGFRNSAISVSINQLYSHPQSSGHWTANLLISFAINPERADSYIRDCASGIGLSKQEAINEAVAAWLAVTAPPLFSLMQCAPFGEAEWLPDGDPLGIAGWDIFSGPYGLRGEDEARNHLLGHLLDYPPLVQLSSTLLAVLRPGIFNTVKLFRGGFGSEIFVECLVNGEHYPAGEQALRELKWPLLKAFATFSQFLFLMPPVR